MGKYITNTEKKRRKALLDKVLARVDEMLLAGYCYHETQNHGKLWIGQSSRGNPRSWYLSWTDKNSRETAFDFQGNKIVHAEAWSRPSSGTRINVEVLDDTATYKALAGVASALEHDNTCRDAVRPRCLVCGEIHSDGDTADAGIVIVAGGIVSYDQVVRMAADPYYDYDRKTFTDPTATIGPLDKVDPSEVANEAIAKYGFGFPDNGEEEYDDQEEEG